MNELSISKAENNLPQTAISGIWFPSNPKIKLDSVKVQMGLKTFSFSHAQFQSGVSFPINALDPGSSINSLLPLSLQLKRRNIIINSTFKSFNTDEVVGNIQQNNWLWETRIIPRFYDNGPCFETVDSCNHLLLGVYLVDSNMIKINGYFVTTKGTIFVNDNKVQIFYKNNPSYKLNCDSAVATMLPCHNFNK